jgi:hypothetical protein
MEFAFAEAEPVFADGRAITIMDDESDPHEQRFVSVGSGAKGRLGWTPRLRQPNKTLFAVRCKIVDRQDHCTAF